MVLSDLSQACTLNPRVIMMTMMVMTTKSVLLLKKEDTILSVFSFTALTNFQNSFTDRNNSNL